MCTILVAIQQHERYPLVLLGNRDEFYGRPTLASHYWQDAVQILAGRDLQSGGTWLGIAKSGRWAVVSNIRGYAGSSGLLSRGQLVSTYLRDPSSPVDYLSQIGLRRAEYGPFNLIIGERESAWFYSSRGEIRRLHNGIYGLSNADLDTPWPKVQRAKSALRPHLQATDKALNPADLLSVLTDTHVAPDAELPDTGIGLVRERMLAPVFVRSPDYGTRCSTLVMIDKEGHARFIEQNYIASGTAELREYEFAIG